MRKLVTSHWGKEVVRCLQAFQVTVQAAFPFVSYQTEKETWPLGASKGQFLGKKSYSKKDVKCYKLLFKT